MAPYFLLVSTHMTRQSNQVDVTGMVTQSIQAKGLESLCCETVLLKS